MVFWGSVGALALVVFLIWKMGTSGKSFSVRVLTGLALGIVLGIALKRWGLSETSELEKAMEWYTLVGSGYIGLLKMISVPLIMVSILSAIVNLETTKGLAKKSAAIILLLVGTTAIAAFIGIMAAKSFGLRADAISVGTAEQKRIEYVTDRSVKTDLTLPAQLLRIIPSNPFAAMSGAGDNSTLAVVFFATLLGISVLILRREEPELADKFRAGVKVIYGAVIELTYLVLELTPYGVLAIMAKTLATTNFEAITTLAKFVGASYAALAAVFCVHLTILAMAGFNPMTYLKKAWPTLSFAFISRTSAGTLPMTIKTLKDGFGLDKGLSGFAASLGTSVGQNGCAGVYPAMLAIMIAPTMGIDISDPSFLMQVILTVAITSFGVAGVGGGATFAGIMVLSALSMPVGLAGVLISVEPVIDMARTAVNVSDSMVAGLVSGKIFNEIDKSVYNSPTVTLESTKI